MTKEEILAMNPRKLDKAVLHTFFPELKSFYYSTYAWQVKEKLNDEGLLLILTDLCPSGENLCRAEFWDNMGLVPSKVVGVAEGEEAPEGNLQGSVIG